MLPGMNNQAQTNLPNTQNTGNNDMIDHLDRFELFFASKWQLLWRGALLLVVIAAVVVGVGAYQRHMNESLATEFASIHYNQDIPKEEKIAEFERLVAAHPNRISSLLPFMELGYQYVEKGEYSKAFDAYKAASEVSGAPDFFVQRAKINLAYVKELQGDKEGALADYNRMLAEVRGNVQLGLEISFAVARVTAETGDINSAVTQLEALEDLSSQSIYSLLIQRLREVYKSRAVPAAMTPIVEADTSAPPAAPAPAAN